MERPGTERLVGDLRAVERLQPIAGRIGERDQPAHEALVSERRRLALHRHAGAFQPRRERIERCRIRDLPAEVALPLGQRAIDHQSLLAVIHPERARTGTAIDRLHAEPVGGVMRPVVEPVRADAEIAEPLDGHCSDPPQRNDIMPQRAPHPGR